MRWTLPVATPCLVGLLLIGVTTAMGASAAHVESNSSGLVAYERTAGPTAPTEIWVMNTDGTNQRRLAEGCCFDWSPDGRRIAFFRDDGLYTIGVDGGGRTRLGDLRTTIFDNRPDWSPDGRKIAFSHKNAIFVVNSDGTGRTQLTSFDRNHDQRPLWSPDGREILFEQYVYERRTSGYDIFVVNADGSGLRRLTHDLGGENPEWSSDGTKIAYFDFPNFEIYVMNADGSEQRNITRTPGVSYFDPRWSPNGKMILFTAAGGKIHTISPDGRHHRNLTPRGRGRRDPEWSADGRSIVFARALRNALDIYVMTARGANLVNITNTARPIQERSPAWSL
jgi:Tol biopolymer transport system component